MASVEPSVSSAQAIAAGGAVGAIASTPTERLAFESATWPLYRALVRRLVLVVGSVPDAEDLAQESYLRAWEAWGRFDGRDARAWLYTIALRLAFNHLRSRRRQLRRLVRGEETTWLDATDPDLVAALRELDGRTRSALLLNAVDGYTQREVADILGAPEGTVVSWISRGRASIRARLSA